MKHIFAIILSIMLLSACGESERNSQLLKRAETVMEDSAEVALAILQDSIDSASLSTERGRAIHALLLSQALDKNYIDIASDSIIAPAVKYFANITTDDNATDVRYAMLTNYYLGRIHLNNNALSKSLISLLNAEQYALQINDYFYLGLIYSTLSCTNNLGHNPLEDLKYSKLAYLYFKKAGIKTHSDIALRDLAIAYNNCHQFNESQKTFNKLLNDSTIIKDSIFMQSVLSQYTQLLYNQSNYDLMKQNIIFLDSMGYKNTTKDYAYLSIAYSNENNLIDAVNYLNKIDNISTINDSIAILNAYIELNLRKNDYKSAFHNLDLFVKAQTHTTNDIWKQSLMGVHRDFVKEQAKTTSLKINAQKQSYFYISLSLALIIIILILILKLVIKNKNSRIENYINTAQEINNLLSIKNQEISSLLELHSNLFNNQIKLFHNICDAYYETPIDSSVSKNKVYECAKNAINKLSLNGKELQEFENFINSHLDNIMIESRKHLPNLKERDFNLLLYIYAGFSSKAIAILTHDKISNVYNRKTRLKAKIEQLNPLEKARLLKYFT